jgi:bifunctional enzyme CysN/CysC
MSIPEQQSSTTSELLALAESASVLRLSTAGSVDDGKSTLIGRMLYDSKGVYEDQVAAAEKAAEKKDSSLMLSLLTDGLKAEREQGITIDVAYRFFSTPKRRFILADTPGHEQYTRNMATGASTADVTIVLIDASKGITTQTKRHSCIASLLGVPRLVIAINKMDMVAYSEQRFNDLVNEYKEFAPRLNVKDISFFPVSALNGDNVVESSKHMPWYHGGPLLEHLENLYIGSDRNQVDFRFPVQYVIRPGDSYRGYAGQIASGSISVGEEIVALPSMQRSRIKSVDIVNKDCQLESIENANTPMSVSLTLSDNIDISRGDILVRTRNQPRITTELELMLVWMSEQPLDTKKQYIFFHGTRKVPGYISEMVYRLDVNSLSRLPPQMLNLNEIGRISVILKSPVCVDSYKQNRSTGCMILIDPDDFQTVAAGMVLDHDHFGEQDLSEKKILHEERGVISRSEREQLFGAKALTFWFTGLSGSGKSTLASVFEKKLFEQGKAVYRLDGDNLRLGLNKDLGFSISDRSENIRRVAEVAKLFNDAGVTVLCSFISPLKQDREVAKGIIGEKSFLEIFVDTPIEVCEKRDPHGMYKKARAGTLKNFTGISAPYEAPEKALLTIKTSSQSVEECLLRLMEVFKSTQENINTH